MSMFCYQCQETAKGTGCEVRGVCGKTEEVAKLQDLLIYTLKGISEVVVKGKLDTKGLGNINHEVMKSLFMTITNANFDAAAFEAEIKKMLKLRNELRAKIAAGQLHDAATFEVSLKEAMVEKLLRSACWQHRTRRALLAGADYLWLERIGGIRSSRSQYRQRKW